MRAFEERSTVLGAHALLLRLDVVLLRVEHREELNMHPHTRFTFSMQSPDPVLSPTRTTTCVEPPAQHRFNSHLSLTPLPSPPPPVGPPAPLCVCHPHTVAQHLALLCLGEIGRRSDLSGVSGVDAAINRALASDSEDVKSAASMALGGVACGNLGKYLPTLLQSIQVGVALTLA